MSLQSHPSWGARGQMRVPADVSAQLEPEHSVCQSLRTAHLGEDFWDPLGSDDSVGVPGMSLKGLKC